MHQDYENLNEYYHETFGDMNSHWKVHIYNEGDSYRF